MSLLERLFFFHQEIRKDKFPNSKSLTDHFEVSSATARRDISYLRDRLLAPLAFDAKRNGFYYHEEGFHLPFEDSPRIIFLLAMLGKLADEAGLGNLPEVEQLEKRLSSMLSPSYGEIVKSLYCERIETERIDRLIFETIVEGLGLKQYVDLEYHAVGGSLTARRIAPLRIINYQGRWYLQAFCVLRQAKRLFHIARIHTAVLTVETIPAQLCADIDDLSDSFGIFSGKPRYLAEVLFTSTAASLVRNQYWHKDQKMIEVPDGVMLQLPVNDDREILMKILQYGSNARVISPPELAERVKHEINAMHENYRDVANDHA